MQAKKIISRAAFILFIILLADVVFELFSGFIQTGASQKIRTLLAVNVPVDKLPEQVIVGMDGHKATFRRGTDSYNQMLSLFRLKHSEQVFMNAGPYPSLQTGIWCGEIAVHHLGLPFHFKIARSTTNPNFLWVALPYGNGRPGVAYPTFIDNGQLSGVVKNSEEQHNNSNPH